jgi:hypothetical protein
MIKTKKNTSRKWSIKYKKSINCNRPAGFSQKQYCKYGRRTHTKKISIKKKKDNKKGLD